MGANRPTTAAAGPDVRRASPASRALLLAAVVTERRRARRPSRDRRRRCRSSLLPSRLPDVPGIELAVDFRPAGRATCVGGDFYDVFEPGDAAGRSWSGDVCGKGPERPRSPASRATHCAPARGTSRARAGVLAVLNDALRHERAARELCTVVYARLDRRRSGVRLTFSTGGHPLPLLLRPDGTVQDRSAHPARARREADPPLVDTTVELQPADARCSTPTASPMPTPPRARSARQTSERSWIVRRSAAPTIPPSASTAARSSSAEPSRATTSRSSCYGSQISIHPPIPVDDTRCARPRRSSPPWTGERVCSPTAGPASTTFAAVDFGADRGNGGGVAGFC